MTTTKGKNTKWFPPTINPVNKGVYELDFSSIGYTENFYSYWDGEHWYNPYQLKDIERCIPNKGKPYNNTKRWRGLTECLMSQ